MFTLEHWKKAGLVRDLNPGPLAPKARIIPLDQRARHTVPVTNCGYEFDMCSLHHLQAMCF